MFKLIKFVFWVCAVIILAYFMTDIRIGGKTIKENVDEFFKSPQGEGLSEKAKTWVEEKIEFVFGNMTKGKVMQTIEEHQDILDEPKKKSPEEIEQDDRSKLKDIFRENTK
ncbi:MAG TPA: hypothetical protein DDW49_05995 [Deltaproteobacteria bacterium]|nr:MAG: hypothetical protein A2048_07740 [Deltaproteobacteria bacterium GWA2_45_12]HBF12924.1 hypothetical protein [Deltaproteobacteria bacterium]